MDIISVFEIVDGYVHSMKSWNDSPTDGSSTSGWDQATSHFINCIVENYPSVADADQQDIINDGWYGNDGYSIYLQRSSVED